MVFDPSVVSFDALLDKFFAVHDPRAQNKTQYMSAVFAQSEEQRQAVQNKIAKLGGPVATKVLPGREWHDAEVRLYFSLNAKETGYEINLCIFLAFAARDKANPTQCSPSLCHGRSTIKTTSRNNLVGVSGKTQHTALE